MSLKFITDKTGLEEIEGMNGHKVPLRMSIETVSFAQHVDGTQNTEFLEQIAADHVVHNPFFGAFVTRFTVWR